VGWYREEAVAALVLEYYWLLRSVLRTKPHLRQCLTRCRHCRIFFLTHPCNASTRRHKLRCPFGCRQAHRQQQSTRRSVAYYRDPDGKTKKSALNQRRASKVSAKPPQTVSPRVSVPQHGSTPWNEAMVEHVRMVSSLIEGRRVSRREILEMLAKVLRQHSLGRCRKIDHSIAWLREHPP